MKEITKKNGSRFITISDLENIQDLAKSIHTSLFSESGNFIISGCALSNVGESTYTVSDGFVYIDNKVRMVSGISDLTTNLFYIAVKDYTENAKYLGKTDVGVNVYAAEIVTVKPSSGSYITVDLTKNALTSPVRIAQSFFGKYCLLSSAGKEQTIYDGLNVLHSLNVSCKGVFSGGINMTGADRDILAHHLGIETDLSVGRNISATGGIAAGSGDITNSLVVGKDLTVGNKLTVNGSLIGNSATFSSINAYEFVVGVGGIKSANINISDTLTTIKANCNIINSNEVITKNIRSPFKNITNPRSVHLNHKENINYHIQITAQSSATLIDTFPVVLPTSLDCDGVVMTLVIDGAAMNTNNGGNFVKVSAGSSQSPAIKVAGLGEVVQSAIIKFTDVVQLHGYVDPVTSKLMWLLMASKPYTTE